MRSTQGCSAAGTDGRRCDLPVDEFGLCTLHFKTLEAKMMARVLSGGCQKPTQSGRPCSGSTGDLCADHERTLERKVLKKVVEGQLDYRVKPRRTAETAFVPPKTPQEARERLQDVLDRRAFVPPADTAYTIPFDDLTFERRRAYGPSLVKDDEQVSFWYFEKTQSGEVVASYGVKGSQAGRDMPLASRKLFVEMMELLKFLPGYTETCESTGRPIQQPLATIVYKLLRGSIGLDDIRFTRFSPDAAKHMREADSGQVAAQRKVVRLTAIEITRALANAGVPPTKITELLNNIAGTSSDEASKTMSFVIGVSAEEARKARREAARRALAESPLLRYGHAVLGKRQSLPARPESGPPMHKSLSEEHG